MPSKTGTRVSPSAAALAARRRLLVPTALTPLIIGGGFQLAAVSLRVLG